MTDSKCYYVGARFGPYDEATALDMVRKLKTQAATVEVTLEQVRNDDKVDVRAYWERKGQ